jgi:tRNA A37 N6-isopentenylltransferase MiaA
VSRVKAGMLNEAKKLHDAGLSYKRMVELGLECRYASLYLQKNITKEQLLSELEMAIWHYAKRQRTWFKKDKSILFIKIIEVFVYDLFEYFVTSPPSSRVLRTSFQPFLKRNF